MCDPKTPSGYVQFNEDLCTGCAACVRCCPTQAIRIREGMSVHLTDRCIGCGECIRVCGTGAMSAPTSELESLKRDQISVALVSPVLYSQFPGEKPENILQGLREMGFCYVVDMSYFLEMFQCAAEEFIARNRENKTYPHPLISPICPVVVRLIAFQFPDLLSHVMPVIRPVALMSREIRRQLVPREPDMTNKTVALYYINPCPTKFAPDRPYFHHEQPYVDRVLGINDIYAELYRHLSQSQGKIAKNGVSGFSQEYFNYCPGPRSLIWGMSGGEIAGMDTEHTLAVSGLRETVTYLEKIEMGLFSDIEYIEFRTCPEGCLGGTLTAIDRYLSKNAVQKAVLKVGAERRVSRREILQLYEKDWFIPKSSLARMTGLFGIQKPPLSIDSLSEIDRLMNLLPGKNCAACGTPNCRTFAEDVVRKKAALSDCPVFCTRQRKK